MASLCWMISTLYLCTLLILTSSETRFCDGSSKKSCTCIHEDTCTLYCIGNDVCKGSDMTLGCKAGRPCNVFCNSDAEENACEDAVIDGSLATSLTVTCSDAKSCHGTRILCGSGDCSVTCTSFSGASAYSQCESTSLSCGSGKCSIECGIGINTCKAVDINILPTTTSFECKQPGWQNNGCSYINNYVSPPFSLTTHSPTRPTQMPTLSPSRLPTISPTFQPTLPTLLPTPYPSRNPSLFPSISPSPSPNSAPTPHDTTLKPTDVPTAPITPTTRSPTMYPTKVPSQYPTLPTYHPTNVPSPAPTKINYYVIGPATDSPTLYDGNGNIYANNGPIHERALSLAMDNLLYSSIAGGILVCCCLIVCIKCCKRSRKTKKLAPQAQRRYVNHGDKKNGLAVYQRPSPQHQSVPSKSLMMFPRAKSALDHDQPPGAMELGMDLGKRAQTEGLMNAPFAMPGASNDFTPGASTNDVNGAQPAFSELLDNDNPLNLQVIDDDDDGTNPLIDAGDNEYVGIDNEDRVDNDVLSDDDDMVCIQ